MCMMWHNLQVQVKVTLDVGSGMLNAIMTWDQVMCMMWQVLTML